MTSLRSSVSQLFGRPLSGTADEDDVNLIESNRRSQIRYNTGLFDTTFVYLFIVSFPGSRRKIRFPIIVQRQFLQILVDPMINLNPF